MLEESRGRGPLKTSTPHKKRAAVLCGREGGRKRLPSFSQLCGRPPASCLALKRTTRKHKKARGLADGLGPRPLPISMHRPASHYFVGGWLAVAFFWLSSSARVERAMLRDDGC